MHRAAEFQIAAEADRQVIQPPLLALDRQQVGKCLRRMAVAAVPGIDVSFTNSALFMVLTVMVSTILFAICLRRRTIVPSISQSIPETIYEFIASLIKENVGVEGLKYFSFIFTLFLFIKFNTIFIKNNFTIKSIYMIKISTI
jgi:F-type H+-transporting ATPase subunit a